MQQRQTILIHHKTRCEFSERRPRLLGMIDRLHTELGAKGIATVTNFH